MPKFTVLNDPPNKEYARYASDVKESDGFVYCFYSRKNPSEKGIVVANPTVTDDREWFAIDVNHFEMRNTGAFIFRSKRDVVLSLLRNHNVLAFSSAQEAFAWLAG